MHMTGISHAIWRKSTERGACVALATLGGSVGVRDSRNSTVDHLTLSPPVWASSRGRSKQASTTSPKTDTLSATEAPGAARVAGAGG
jgi:hypothetical protein